MSDLDSLFPRPLRLLYYDIETAPLLSFIWSLRQKYLSAEMLEHDTFLLSWAAKWSDSPTLISKVLTPAEAKRQDDRRLVEGLAELIRKADVIVAHNGDRFDLPKLNGRLLVHGMEPVGQTQSVDTLKIARATFGVASNKLDYLAKLLGLDGKHDTDFDLWRSCYQGSKEALSRMVAYNRYDVVLLEQIFHAIKPHAKSLPRLVDATEYMQDVCPTCGSREHKRDGYYRTKANTFPRFRCSSCGRRFRSRQSIGTTKTAGVAL